MDELIVNAINNIYGILLNINARLSVIENQLLNSPLTTPAPPQQFPITIDENARPHFDLLETNIPY